MHEGLAHMYATSKSWFPLKYLRDYLTAEGTRSIFSLAIAVEIGSTIFHYGFHCVYVYLRVSGQFLSFLKYSYIFWMAWTFGCI